VKRQLPALHTNVFMKAWMTQFQDIICDDE